MNRSRMMSTEDLDQKEKRIRRIQFEAIKLRKDHDRGLIGDKCYEIRKQQVKNAYKDVRK